MSTKKRKRLRGSGVRHTIPHLGRFAGLWVLVTVLAVLVASVSSWLLFAERSHEFAAMLVLQTAVIILAIVALGVFTTHRLAGPWIAVQRALDRVRDGDLDSELRIRSADSHMRQVERSFNGMLAALREKRRERPA